MRPAIPTHTHTRAPIFSRPYGGGTAGRPRVATASSLRSSPDECYPGNLRPLKLKSFHYVYALYGPCMSYTTGSSAARPPLATHFFRHVGHSSRFPTPLARSGLPTSPATPRVKCTYKIPGILRQDMLLR